jgi:hypothetical protein
MVTPFGLSHQFLQARQLGKLFSPSLAVSFPCRVIKFLARSTHDPTFDRRNFLAVSARLFRQGLGWVNPFGTSVPVVILAALTAKFRLSVFLKLD